MKSPGWGAGALCVVSGGELTTGGGMLLNVLTRIVFRSFSKSFSKVHCRLPEHDRSEVGTHANLVRW